MLLPWWLAVKHSGPMVEENTPLMQVPFFDLHTITAIKFVAQTAT